MRFKILPVAAGLALVAGISSLAAAWHGTLGVNFGWPADANSVQFCGSANGLAALAGVVGILAGLVLLVIILIRALLRPSRG